MCRKGSEQGMITSTANPRVKQLVQWQSEAKARRRDGVFVVEGIKMLQEAPADRLREIYITEELKRKLQEGKSEGEKALWSKIEQNGYETLSFEVMKKAADTQTPQGILAVLERPVYQKEEMLAAKNGFFLVLEDLQDPGNLGTIIRTGEGAGVNGVFLSKNTVDIFNPKTIRSTMGSIYRVPFLHVESLADLLLDMKEKEIAVYAAHLRGEDYYDSFSFRTGCAFLIGNEGKGLSGETAAAADFYFKIHMEGKVESLNAAIAAALLSYEVHRQRKGRN